jgi:hypothetical protein
MTIDERSRRWHRVSHATTDDTTGPEPQRSACYPNTHHVHGVAGRCGRGRSTDTADQPCTGITVKTGRPIAASVVSVATPLTEPLRRTVEQPGIAGHHGHHFRMTPGPDQDGDSRFLAHPLGPRRPVVLHSGDFFGTPARTAPSCFFLSPRWIYGFTGDLRLGVGSSGWFPSIRGAVVAGVDGHLSPGLCVAGLQNCAGSMGEVRLV